MDSKQNSICFNITSCLGKLKCFYVRFIIMFITAHHDPCLEPGRPEHRRLYSGSLRAGRSVDRIPIGARFSVPSRLVLHKVYRDLSRE